ncbi:MAG: alpha/beta fold hydrolase [Polyangiales bacterium]
MADDVERFEFTGKRGQRLSGRIHLPAVEPVAWAVFVHCFTCSKDSRAARWVSAALAEQGIATLRFDFTGLGESDGTFDGAAFSGDVDDIVSAADALRNAGRAPALLVGHSRGGTAALAAAAEIPEVVGIATIGSPFDAEKVSAERIGSLRKALLVFHSPQDQVVGIDDARLIFQAARHPKSFISLDGADHLLGRGSDAKYVAQVLASWAGRYLPEQQAPEIPEDAPEGLVVVEGKTTGFLQRIQARNLVFASDEPLDQGGTNLGPSPYELLLAGLGACTSMTLKLYAGRKEWPLEGVRVTLRHDRVHATDCEDCEKDTGMIDLIEKKLELEGELSEKQRERLLAISARCPVHRTLLNEIKIRSELA